MDDVGISAADEDEGHVAGGEGFGDGQRILAGAEIKVEQGQIDVGHFRCGHAGRQRRQRADHAAAEAEQRVFEVERDERIVLDDEYDGGGLKLRHRRNSVG